MKRWILAALLLLTLTGCGKQETGPKTAVCFAVAHTANSQGLNFSAPKVSETVLNAVANYGYVSVVSIDGSPEIVVAQSFDIPEQYKKASKSKLEADAQANAAAVRNALQAVEANDPEADYLAGLQLAVRSLTAADGEKTIVVLGTGLSTTGELDFRNNLLSAEPAVIAQQLDERKAIPDLRGITVLWQQMGDTAAPQPELTQRQKENLEAIWRAIVEQGGGRLVVDPFPAVNPGNEALPAVSPVNLPAEAPIRFEPEQAENLLNAPLMLTEEQVTFVGDEANFLRPEEAVDTIRPVAEYLLRNPQVSILLVGTTAGDATTEYTSQLSRERAETVRDTLISLGVAEDRITAVGMGSSDPWHIAGAGIDGPLAAANRKVVILDAQSEAAKGILGQ